MSEPPTLKDNKPRNHRVGFRVRPGEYHRILQNAASVHMTVPEYVRHAVLDGKIIVAAPPADPEVSAQLHRLGVKINDAVRRMHSTGEMPPELLSLARDVQRLLEEKFGAGSPT